MFDIARKYEAKGIIKAYERLNSSQEEIWEAIADELDVSMEEAQRLYDDYKARECALV